MRRLLGILLLLGVLCGCAGAEIPCQCGQEACQCFIQQGDEGPAVEYIQHALIALGYLQANEDASDFDEVTCQAVMRFQEDNGLSPTGMMDDDTLTLLLWGMTPEELSTLQPWSIADPVWIPTDGGERHHRKVDCAPHLFTISDPRLVSQRNAMALGFLPCGICHPTGHDTDLSYYKER